MSSSISSVAYPDYPRSAADQDRSGSTRSFQGAAAVAATVSRAAEAKQRTGEVPVTEAVQKVQDFVKVVSRDLEFSVDEETGRTVIRVYDSVSGELVRQIPPEELLAVAENLDRARGILFQGQA